MSRSKGDDTVIAGKHQPLQETGLPDARPIPGREGEKKEQPMQILAELYELLEAYAPPWYTEELHQRALAVLHRAGKM